jgi:hypothetical protein
MYKTAEFLYYFYVETVFALQLRCNLRDLQFCTSVHIMTSLSAAVGKQDHYNFEDWHPCPLNVSLLRVNYNDCGMQYMLKIWNACAFNVTLAVVSILHEYFLQ